MARTETKALELGFQAPNFNLWDVTSDKSVSLNDLKSDKATVIMFICNHCPFVKHVNTEIVRLAKDYQPKGISFIAISSNDVDKYPDDSPEQMKITAQHEGYTFPYLYDETQETAKAYDAVCTPIDSEIPTPHSPRKSPCTFSMLNESS